MTEKEFCKIVEYICEYSYRNMWLRTGSFNEILAYLEGYAWGAQLDMHGHHTFSTPFQLWLKIKFSSEKNIFNWDEYRKLFPDEDDAIVNLPVLYREFAESSYVKNLPKDAN